MLYNLKSEFSVTKFREHVERLIKSGKQCELKEVRKKRTSNQNNYVHALFSYWGAHQGYTTEESKTIIKRQCGLVYEKDGHKFLTSTASLDVKEMSEFIEKFRNWSSAICDVYLPTAEEFEQNYAEIMNTINAHKAHL
jgi:hypothetical protein